MSARRPWLCLSLLLASAALMTVGVAATIDTPGRLSGAGAAGWSTISFVPPVAAFSIVGGLISLRRPSNMIGWLLAAIGLLFSIVVACSSLSAWALTTKALPEAVAEWVSVGSNASGSA